MDLFSKQRKELSAWELPWALVWQNDDWLKSMLSKGLVPVLAGADLIAMSEEDSDWDADLRDEGVRYVLALVRASNDTPADFAKALGSKMVEDLESSLRPGFQFDSTKSMFSLEGENENVKVYIGFHEGDFWPESVEDYQPFLATIRDKVSTGLVYYSDDKQTIYGCSEPDLTIEKDSFAAPLPTELRGIDGNSWCVFLKDETVSEFWLWHVRQKAGKVSNSGS